jgi:hypothetical protein
MTSRLSLTIIPALDTAWEFESSGELQRVVVSLTDELGALGLIEPSLP